MYDKQTLRSQYERKRSLFVAEHEKKDWASLQAKLNENIGRVLSELPSGLILSYRALRSEADPASVAWSERRHTWAYPKVSGDLLEFYQADSAEDFEKGQLGIMEPVADTSRRIRMDQVQAVLVPAVAFDLNGQRLGRGKGHYDRALVAMPKALRIGIGFSCQLSFQPLPVEAHDQRMHFIVTEDLIWCPHWETWMPSQEMKG